MLATSEVKTAVTPPVSVTGRKAICGGVHQTDHSTDLETIHEIRDSSPSLPMFESRDAFSTYAIDICAGCHFRLGGHNIYGIVFSGPHDFRPHGAWEFDSFYCGHSGWD